MCLLLIFFLMTVSLFRFCLQVPVLVLEAGLDRLVRPDGIERFRKRVPQARYRIFDGAYHDLFDETDDIRQEGGGFHGCDVVGGFDGVIFIFCGGRLSVCLVWWWWWGDVAALLPAGWQNYRLLITLCCPRAC